MLDFLTIFFFFVLGLTIGWVAGVLFGYNLGVKETEKRWSDAVEKKENEVYRDFCETKAYRDAVSAANFYLKKKAKEYADDITKIMEEQQKRLDNESQKP